MKISIIVPVYNVEAFIIECLDSIVMQKYDGELECIIVDDCGTDNSIRLCENYIEKYIGDIKFSIIKHKQNRGLSAGRNTGLKAATGDYVYFLDSDDYIQKDTIKALAKPLEIFTPDFVIGDYNLVGSNRLYPKLKLKEGVYNGNDTIINSFCKEQWYMMAWNKLCNRQFLLKNNITFQEGLIHEDNLWSFALACKANSMYVTNIRTYNYRIRQNSITTNDLTNARKNHDAFLSVFIGMHKVYSESYTYNKVADDYLQHFCVSFLTTAFRNNMDFCADYKIIYDTMNYHTFKKFLSGKIRFISLIKRFHYSMPFTIAKKIAYLYIKTKA